MCDSRNGDGRRGKPSWGSAPTPGMFVFLVYIYIFISSRVFMRLLLFSLSLLRIERHNSDQGTLDSSPPPLHYGSCLFCSYLYRETTSRPFCPPRRLRFVELTSYWPNSHLTVVAASPSASVFFYRLRFFRVENYRLTGIHSLPLPHTECFDFEI